MELRHLRYFVAVAEAGSMTVAAEQRLHTAQPSLSRQIRDLEVEVGAQLLTRSAHGIKLTKAGQAFFDHARLVLAEADAAKVAARRAAHPERDVLSLGFLSGEDVEWLPEAMRVLRSELPNIEVKVVTGHSPDIAEAISKRTIDVGFIRPERSAPDLVYKLLRKEPLLAIVASDHRLHTEKSVDPADLSGEKFIGIPEFPLLDVLLAQGQNFEQRQRLLGVLIALHVLNDELRFSILRDKQRLTRGRQILDDLRCVAFQVADWLYVICQAHV